MKLTILISMLSVLPIYAESLINLPESKVITGTAHRPQKSLTIKFTQNQKYLIEENLVDDSEDVSEQNSFSGSTLAKHKSQKIKSFIKRFKIFTPLARAILAIGILPATILPQAVWLP